MTQRTGGLLSRTRRSWDRLRWALALGWIAVVVVLPLSAYRRATWSGAHGLFVADDHTGDLDRDRFLGFREPTWISIAVFALGILTFVVLVWGPQPWRATKWAWFWLLALPPVPLLFTLLSGPVPGLPAPRDPSRRLTGGWAFLIAMIVNGSLITINLGFS